MTEAESLWIGEGCEMQLEEVVGDQKLKLQLECLPGGRVHVQKSVITKNKKDHAEIAISHDYLFSSASELLEWWENDTHRFMFARVMGEAKKWAVDKFNVAASSRH